MSTLSTPLTDDRATGTLGATVPDERTAVERVGRLRLVGQGATIAQAAITASSARHQTCGMVEVEGGDEVHKPLRTLAMGLVVPLLMMTLGACGSDKDAEPGTGAASDRAAGANGDAYCSSLKSAGWQVVVHDFLSLDDAADFAALRTNIRTLESSAPVEVKAAWSVLGEDHDRFTELMDGAGLSIDELLYWDDNGELPATVDPKQFEQFFRRLTALDYSKVDAATDTIVAHAKTECDIDLRSD